MAVTTNSEGRLATATGEGGTPQVPLIRYPSGSWISPRGAQDSGGQTQNELRLAPIEIPHNLTVNMLRVRLKSQVAGAVFRLGLYNGNGGLPGALLADLGTFDASVAGGALGTRDLATNLDLTTGLVYTATVCQGNTGASLTINSLAPVNAHVPFPDTVGDPELPRHGLQIAGVSGALPADASAAVRSANSMPRTLLRVA